MRASIVWVIIAAVVVTAIVALVGQQLIQPDQPPIVSAAFSHEQITPNADGDTDITEYTYELSENGIVSLMFTSEDGATFAFRNNEQRAAGEYSGLFSGVVDGYVLDGETVRGDVMRRLMPNGTYTWELTLETETGETDSRSGTLIIADADAALPEISTFTVSPEVFTPNQDGIRDRTQINVYLEKDADLDVYLVTENGVQIFIPPQITETRDGEAGRYTFDYDGGVDGGGDPPPDGTYTVIASAQDAVGQRVQRMGTLTLGDGGKPRAEIATQPGGADVIFDVIPYEDTFFSTLDEMGSPIDAPTDPEASNIRDVTMQVGDVLIFRLVVENYSDVPIRTHGAPPGTVYDQNQRAATLGDFDQSGAWRVGLDCDTAVSDYPWRWAIGDTETLETVFDEETGNTYYYLAPGERAVVWGGIRMTELIDSRNPQNCWAGLIHEDVGVSIRNSRVGARSIELVDPNDPLYDDEADAG
jgi:hypothetical protein